MSFILIQLGSREEGGVFVFLAYFDVPIHIKRETKHRHHRPKGVLAISKVEKQGLPYVKILFWNYTVEMIRDPMPNPWILEEYFVATKSPYLDESRNE